MAESKVSYTFNSVNSGGYDNFGSYYGHSTNASTSNLFFEEAAFYAFDSKSIYQAERDLSPVSVTLTYTLSNADLSTQTVDLSFAHYQSPVQTQLDSDSTDSSGGYATANVYNDLYNTTSVAAVTVTNQAVTKSMDVAQYIASSAAASTSTGGGTGGIGVVQVPETYVIFSPHGDNGGLTYPSNVTITVTGYVTSGNPTISGLVSDQQVTQGTRVTPFSSVTLADPGNPSGAGDDIVITILDANGNGTDAYGTLSGKGLTSEGYGSYEISPTTSVTALQTALASLVFTAGAQAPGTDPIKLTFELDVQAGNGGATDNQFASVDIMSAAIACYCRGTLVLTRNAEKAVETLAIGDTVITAAGQGRAIRWIGHRSYAGRFLLANPRVQPIRFSAGSLGDGLPRRDLLVSPEHAMFLHGLLVPARCLVNGTTISQIHVGRVDYVHVELDSHDLLLAEGAPSETFIDDDSRGVFHNAAEFRTLYPAAPRQQMYCAPRVEQGAGLEAIRRRLARVAEAIIQAA